MPSLLIHGESNIGKSMIIQKFLRDHPQREFNDETGLLQLDRWRWRCPRRRTSSVCMGRC